MSNYKRIYLENFSYVLTLVSYERKPILIDNIELLRDSFRRSKEKYEYKINAIVILPNHFHMIITPKIAKEYSKIISHIKRSFIYGLDESTRNESKFEMSASKYRRQNSTIWQRRFYEHTIRDEKDFKQQLEYLKNNPVKHGLVNDSKDWEYSSFNKKS